MRDAMFMGGARVLGAGWLSWPCEWHGHWYLAKHVVGSTTFLVSGDTLVPWRYVSVGCITCLVFSRPSTTVSMSILPSWRLRRHRSLFFVLFRVKTWSSREGGGGIPVVYPSSRHDFGVHASSVSDFTSSRCLAHGGGFRPL